jgi:hypothetical protein
MSSAAEARFRIQAPNSKPRTIKVIAVDAPAERVVKRLAAGVWTNATFFTAADARDGEAPLRDLTRAPRDLMGEVETSDLVVMVATPGGHAEASSAIGEACSLRRVHTTALIVGAANASDEAVSRTLAQVRPWSLMVVIANPDDYIDDMLTALRA